MLLVSEFTGSPVHRLTTMFLQRFNHLVGGKAGGVGIGQHSRHERSQPTIVLARRMSPRRRCRDERAHAAPGLDHAGPFELGVYTGDGVGIDAEIDRQLTHGRQLVARDVDIYPPADEGWGGRFITIQDPDKYRLLTLEG